MERNIYKIGKELFITNDEEIQEEKCINLAHNVIVKPTNSKWANSNSNNLKKVILTTDVDLIKDGVQAIDNEFLEWFVKNPSCEEVEVVDEIIEDTSKDYIIGLGQPCTTIYKIIIPKEEQKELRRKLFTLIKSLEQEEPKQERLEEDALRLYPRLINDSYNPMEDDNEEFRNIWIKGAKWQQEDMIEKLEMHILINEDDWNRNPQAQFRNFIEQFKKK